MKRRLLILALLVSVVAPAGAAPIVTLGPPVSDSFSTVNPGSIRVDALSAGDIVDLQVSITIDPFCFRPIDVGLNTIGDGGTFSDQTGVVTNGCGGDTSVFDIRLAGDGLAHTFDIEFVDVDTGVPLRSIPVELIPVAVDTDSDADGVPDSADNCTLIANPIQRDSNGDGFGNLCDPDLDNDGNVTAVDLGLLRLVFFSADADADFNGDGVVNVADLGVLRAFFFLAPGPSGLAP